MNGQGINKTITLFKAGQQNLYLPCEQFRGRWLFLSISGQMVNDLRTDEAPKAELMCSVKHVQPLVLTDEVTEWTRGGGQRRMKGHQAPSKSVKSFRFFRK